MISEARAGSVLILSLWVLMFLSILAIAVGAYVDAGVGLAARMRSRTTAYCMARAGVEKAMFETACDTNDWDALIEPWGNNEKVFRNAAIGEGYFSVYCARMTGSGGIATNYGVIDEESKINVNKASHGLLKAFLEVAGGADSLAAAEIASAICDWRDENDEPLTGGAENSYYRSLSNPYPCHNGEFQSLNELLLVKGVEPELFRRLEPHATLYGTGKVNVNTADPVVLKSVAVSCGGGNGGMADSLAAKIVLFREAGNAFRHASASSIAVELNAFARLQPDEQALLSAMMSVLTLRSTCFGGLATGKMNGRSEEDARIAFVFDRGNLAKLYWHEY